MLKPIVQAAFVGLLLSGCGDDPSTATLAARTYVWDTQQRDYEVVGVSGSDVPGIGDQTRTIQAIYADPESIDQVRNALNEMYGELRKDIEETQRDAKYRRINIAIFDAGADIRHDPRAWLCQLSVSPEPKEELPEDPAPFVLWQWRDPQARPTDAEREIEWAYLAKLEDANLSVQFPITDGDMIGMPAAERRTFLERRYAGEAELFKKELSTANGMTVEELQSLLDRIMAWKYREEALLAPPEGDDLDQPESETATPGDD